INVAPERIAAGVLMQPIGEDETNPGLFGPNMWRPWGQNLVDKGASFSMQQVDAFGHSLFDSGFVFTATRDELKNIRTPLLLLYGNDQAHPQGISVEVQQLLPNVQVVREWREGEALQEATQ